MSSVLVTPRSDRWLTLAGAYFSAIRGFGVDVGIPVEVRAAFRFIRCRETAVIIDAGANIGEWSREIRPALGSPATIFLFEPAPGAVERLRREPIAGARIVPMALGETSGLLPLYATTTADKAASLHVRRDSFFGDLSQSSEMVEVTTLDDFLAGQGIGMVDFLKLDLEGHELFALRGASRALADGRVRAVAFEFGISNLNSRTFFKDLWDLLRGHGYRLYRLTPAGALLAVDRYSEELECFARWATWFAAFEPPRQTDR